MARLSIDAALEEWSGEPVEVELGGKIFPIRLPLPSGYALQANRAMRKKDDQAAMAAMDKLLEALFGERYDEFLDTVTELRLSEKQLEEIIEWVGEQAAGRPTGQRSGSATLQESTGQPSSDAAASGD